MAAVSILFLLRHGVWLAQRGDLLVLEPCALAECSTAWDL